MTKTTHTVHDKDNTNYSLLSLFSALQQPHATKIEMLYSVSQKKPDCYNRYHITSPIHNIH